jgi:hypothetical protein
MVQEPKSAPSSWIQEMEKHSSGKIWLAIFFLISGYTSHFPSSCLLLPIATLASACLFRNKTLFHSILFGLFSHSFSMSFFNLDSGKKLYWQMEGKAEESCGKVK